MRLIQGKKTSWIWLFITAMLFAAAYLLRTQGNTTWSPFCFYIGLLTLIIAVQALR